jgi:phospholipid/cholesterol/gamma-HCH transport system permease protein
MSDSASQARAEATREGDTLQVRLGGDWRITAPRPAWSELAGDAPAKRVRLTADGLGAWDSSLALFLREARRWSDAHGATMEVAGLPAGLLRLTGGLMGKTAAPAGPHVGLPGIFTTVGLATAELWGEAKDIAQLVGECFYSVLRFFRAQAQFRWRDCVAEMQACGAMALPIVGLISFLTGVTMAYTGAIVLRQYGGDIYLADMVGLAVVREMGPMMAAVTLAGRTGAAFAATLGSMRANEEVDALETLGISPVDFLVMPRIVALFLMMPLLALYSDLVGMLGGLAVAVGLLDIPANLYWVETKSIVDLSDLSTGLIKAATYGLLVGLSGCLRGLQADRSATGVGVAATRAVVTSLLLIIVADAIYAVAFNILGW